MFTSTNFELRVRDLESARRFYVDQLGLPVLQDTPTMSLIAVKAGSVRLSIFDNRKDAGGAGPSHLILATGNLDLTIAALEAKGVSFEGPPVEAGGFLRFVMTRDPEGNGVAISQYYKDPLATA